MHRFFVSPDDLTPDRVSLTGTVVHQLRNVLRMTPGSRIIVLDDSGWEYEVELTEVSRELVEGVVLVRRLTETEPQVKISLYQSLLKGDRFEFVLQKCTEVGVVEFVPTLAARCVVSNLDIDPRRMDRWERIIQEAAEQAYRGRLPRLQPAMLLAEACKRMVRAGPALMLHEGVTQASLHSLVAELDADPNGSSLFNVSVLVGPEGGFTDAEVDQAAGYGVRPVSLGPRILRSETAGLVTAAAILYHRGELEPLE
ncbi:MAG: 16S rRNA (uracil(1498)-N(3))-methyltransferase [Chloroflexi bacterium]|nr:16S rRNA (uracil(1498)-N(3))-methyltransferase [Chloroflexota bacterium]MBU1747715.1 16S rRNA (uracil(1498)-N(3))-methyltransferase [Chloroflexota bacterium]MBU1878142.1 16S rRNA (uracil(1498)-N(3))-methyltransferase [Chloroflexota bacterium]